MNMCCTSYVDAAKINMNMCCISDVDAAKSNVELY